MKRALSLYHIKLDICYSSYHYRCTNLYFLIASFVRALLIKSEAHRQMRTFACKLPLRLASIMAVTVDWSKEPGYCKCILPNGTEYCNAMRYDHRNIPTFENGFISRVSHIKENFISKDGDILIYGYMKSGLYITCMCTG